jgi:hypothetical protein
MIASILQDTFSQSYKISGYPFPPLIVQVLDAQQPPPKL